MNLRNRLLAAPLLAGLCSPALAQWEWQPAPLSQVWVNPGFYSIHFDRNAGLRDGNPGLGFEWQVTKWVSLTAGRFRNSDDRMSNYAGAYVMPWSWGAWRFGAVVGGFDGYPKANDGGWFPALIPVISYERRYVGLNVGIVPEIKDRLHGAISFQLKFRFDGPAGDESAAQGGQAPAR